VEVQTFKGTTPFRRADEDTPGKGVINNTHSNDVESPSPPTRLCMNIHTQCMPCSDLSGVLVLNDPAAGGRGRPTGDRQPGHVARRARQGGAVQDDPIEPKLKLPGTKRLKLRCDEPLSKFDFIFNLRRHSKGLAKRLMAAVEDQCREW
jgi:hypothetical protein